MDVTTPLINARQVAAGALLEELALRPGSDVVVRVQTAPPGGGRGVISLAGILMSAQLPAGLAAGQRLPVRVVQAGANEVLLRVRTDAEPAAAPAPGHLAQVAGAAALTGDGKLVQVANELQQPGLALPLPNGDALTLAVHEDEQGEEGDAGKKGGEASFVLHSAALGPIEARVRLVDGSVTVSVRVEPEARDRFAAAASELAGTLEAATSAPARVEVVSRRPEQARPDQPRVDETFDAYA